VETLTQRWREALLDEVCAASRAAMRVRTTDLKTPNPVMKRV